MAEMVSIMIVGDDPAARAAFAVDLSDLGLSVSEAMAGDEALAKARVESPDGIVWVCGCADGHSAEAK